MTFTKKQPRENMSEKHIRMEASNRRFSKKKKRSKQYKQNQQRQTMWMFATQQWARFRKTSLWIQVVVVFSVTFYISAIVLNVDHSK